MRQNSNLSNFAKALVELAHEQNKLDLIVYQFETIMEIVKTIPNFLEYLAINGYTVENHLDKLEGYDPLLINFLDVCNKNNVSRNLKYIYYDFRNLANKYQKQAFVKVYSARPLTDEQKNQIVKNLQKIIPDKEVVMHTKIDKSVLAGIKITYQGKNLDYTLEKYLDDMFKEIGR